MIEKVEEEIEHMNNRYQKTGENFAGIAFISFLNEDMKNLVLALN